MAQNAKKWMMARCKKFLTLALFSCGACLSINAVADDAPPKSATFRTPDGAYLVTIGGALVDPYFVNKALIVGTQAGMNLRDPVKGWLRWLLPRQRADGGFDRYCPEGKSSTWRVCKGADADDSMAATLMQLVALAKARGWLAGQLAHDADKAVQGSNRMLTTLLNPENGLYRVFPGTELYYLMDSAEVYEGLIASGQHSAAQNLASAIRKHFYVNSQWVPAIPAYKQERFYPHALAAAYLWGMPFQLGSHGAPVQAETAAWLAHHGPAWLSREKDPYSWGLVAWQMRQHAPIYAACWRYSLRPYDKSMGWTVLDAFVEEALAHVGVPSSCPDNLKPKSVLPARKPQ